MFQPKVKVIELIFESISYVKECSVILIRKDIADKWTEASQSHIY